ncbi:MAG: type IVB secretion system apparatus protein IcmL/DotI [Gammaproteobacteria bacterium]|nr:type IVB secretion system apparatus protein IcmL/DotI [Gammaproteobacteria bacterium]MCH9744096.1 type IVB secretion system apparatus protein IcmL/DotI [Gammaproteobacteria bacterium]
MTQDTKKSAGVELVVMRNAFYRDSYRRALFALVLLVFVNILLAGSIVYKVLNPPPAEYFATTAEGRLINIHPLSDPVVTDSYVLQWAADQTRAAFSQDFIHWRKQLQDASSAFTPGGWKYFLQSMKSSNNLKTLTANMMVSNAAITGAPQIIEKAVVNGHYAWKIQMPVLVTYTNGSQTIPMPMDVTLLVLRMPVQDYPQRIAINNFLPVPTKTAEQSLYTSGI